MLKQAWLSTLLLRPQHMKQPWNEGREWRPVLFVCDEYQQFVTVGESDPSGDEKAFALTRRASAFRSWRPSRSPPSVPRSGRGSRAGRSADAALAHLPPVGGRRVGEDGLRSVRAGHAHEGVLLGQREHVPRGVSWLSGRAGGGGSSAGLSKSYQERREPLFTPRDFLVLGNYRAIVQLFDGKSSATPCAAFSCPTTSSGSSAGGSRGSGRRRGVLLMVEVQVSLGEVAEYISSLRQFVDDDGVSEIIINGPGKLFVERGGRLEQVPVGEGALTERDLDAATNCITRGSVLRSAVDAGRGRAASDGSRGGHRRAAASPSIAVTIRRFGKCNWSASQLVEMGSLPAAGARGHPGDARERRERPHRRRYRFREDLAAQRLRGVAPRGRPDRRHRGRHGDPGHARQFPAARGASGGRRPVERHDPRAGPAHVAATGRITSWWARSAGRRRPMSCRRS